MDHFNFTGLRLDEAFRLVIPYFLNLNSLDHSVLTYSCMVKRK